MLTDDGSTAFEGVTVCYFAVKWPVISFISIQSSPMPDQTTFARAKPKSQSKHCSTLQIIETNSLKRLVSKVLNILKVRFRKSSLKNVRSSSSPIRLVANHPFKTFAAYDRPLDVQEDFMRSYRSYVKITFFK